MNKKALMRLDQIIISIIFFSLVLVAGVVVIGDVNTNYNANIDEGQFSNTLDNVTNTYNIGKDLNDKTVDADISEGAVEDALFAGGFVGARQAVKGNIGIISTAMVELAGALNIPQYMVTMAMSAISITLLFGLIYLIFRVIPR